MGAPGGQKPLFSPKMTPNIDSMLKSSQFGPFIKFLQPVMQLILKIGYQGLT